jgi:hypothetical protein
MEQHVSPERERQVLVGVLALTRNSGTERPTSRTALVLAVLVVGLALFLGLRVYESLPVAQMLAALVGAAIGAILAFLVAAEFFAERVGVLCSVIDQDLVQARLRELGR